jgi:hypothetical protein
VKKGGLVGMMLGWEWDGLERVVKGRGDGVDLQGRVSSFSNVSRLTFRSYWLKSIGGYRPKSLQADLSYVMERLTL